MPRGPRTTLSQMGRGSIRPLIFRSLRRPLASSDLQANREGLFGRPATMTAIVYQSSSQYNCDCQRNGKPTVRWGRKATGPSGSAELPNEGAGHAPQDHR